MNILVTGASAGFGAAISRLLVAQGHTVIGTARRQQKLEALAQELGNNFIPLAFDISDTTAMEQALAQLEQQNLHIDVLVNNAGLALGMDKAQDAKLADWEVMINTNVMGLVRMTHALLPQMVARNSGYIINIGSIAGTWPYQGGNIYGATKAFVRQFSLNLRTDLRGTKVRVTNVEPGLCGDTEFSIVRFNGDVAKAQALYQDRDYIKPEDIADIISYLIHSPEHVNVNTLEVMPTCQSYAGFVVTNRTA